MTNKTQDRENVLDTFDITNIEKWNATRSHVTQPTELERLSRQYSIIRCQEKLWHALGDGRNGHVRKRRVSPFCDISVTLEQ